MKSAGRLLLLAGAAGLALSVLLPWVTVKGLALNLDLGVVGADITPGSRTVAGVETSVWPVAVGVAAVVFVLTLLNVARMLLAVLGLLVTAAGGGLLYYTANVIDIETRDGGPIAQAIANAVVESSTGPGPPLILASGIAILAGALMS
ncbi:MAG: hypothetical protein ACR2H2_18775 [Solirubrobacteraceae bacterium]